MDLPRASFHADFDFATGRFFCWSRRGLCVASTSPFDVRTYGVAGGESAPSDAIIKGGLSRLWLFSQDFAKYKTFPRRYSQGIRSFRRISETKEERRVWKTAASVEAFLEAVGVDLIQRLAVFEAAPQLHFYMLSLVHQAPRIHRLLEQCCQLFFALAVYTRHLDADDAIRLVQWAAVTRHSTICERLGICSHRILARMYPRHMTPSSLHRFCVQVNQHREIRRVVSHLKVIPRQAIVITSAGLSAFQQVHNRVFEELSSDPNEYLHAGNDVLALRCVSKELGSAITLPVVQSLKHLAKLRIRFGINTYPRGCRRIKRFLRTEFPDPPFTSQWLRPITTMRDLRRVGLLLGNCLAQGTFDAECLCGESMFYWRHPTLFEPYPIVIQIARERAVMGGWRFVRAEGPRNKSLSSEQIELLKAEVARLKADGAPISSVYEEDIR
ncbi:MAG: hypothetical protein ACOC7K_02785 [bacterium]